jgi:catalase-peroxidase
MILTGNVALESMGFKPSALPAVVPMCGSRRKTSTGAPKAMAGRQALQVTTQLENPLAAVQMGLIYVNPEGPNGNPIRSPPPRTSARPSPAWP